jgi:hypothetical protein
VCCVVARGFQKELEQMESLFVVIVVDLVVATYFCKNDYYNLGIQANESAPDA